MLFLSLREDKRTETPMGPTVYFLLLGFLGKELVCQCRRHKRHSSIPRSGRSPGGGNGNPLLYSCLGNPMDRGAWWATVHGVTKSQMRLSIHVL